MSHTKARIIAALTAAILTISFTAPAMAAEPQIIVPQNGILTNGKPIAEENVLEILHQLEVEWSAWTLWDDPKLNPDTNKNTVLSTETAKLMRSYHTNGTYRYGGYASMISSRIFGDQANPCRRLEDLTQIRPSDVIFRVSNTTGRIWHVTVALESPNDLHGYHVTDGNHGGIVYWPDENSQYSREHLDCYGEDKNYCLEAWTRYPESVFYTGDSIDAWSTGKEIAFKLPIPSQTPQ